MRDELGDRAHHVGHRQLGRRRIAGDEVEALEAGALQGGLELLLAVCPGQNSHHSLVAIVTSSRGQPDAAKTSPKTTSE